MKQLGIVLMIALAWAGCKKEDSGFSEIPEITFKSISDTEVVEFDNNVAVTFRYKDGNGDLGYADPDAYSLRIKDSRLEEYDWYHLPPVTPDMDELQVEGTFTVYLNTLFLLGNGGQESADFTLQLRDRAGNWSNQIVTPVVLINDSL
ncbi:MAG: hypothetical protein KDC12_04230 [Flavobacteriales bacterium]|nr:hypothetical protein [Flavobacteriales bacterium]